jgi:hypothetical protein
VALGTAAPRPAAPVLGAEAFGSLLVEADHDAVFGLLAVESEDPVRLLLVLRVGALLPAACPLQRDPVAGKDAAKLGGRDLEPLPAQVAGKLGQAPACVGHPERVGTGAGDRDDPGFVVKRDPAGPPAPKTRAQRLEPVPVEVVDHLAHLRLVREQHGRDLGRTHQRVRGEQNHRPLPRRGQLRLLRQPLNRCPHAEPTRGQTPPADASTPPQVACVRIRHQTERSRHVPGQTLREGALAGAAQASLLNGGACERSGR